MDGFLSTHPRKDRKQFYINSCGRVFVTDHRVLSILPTEAPRGYPSPEDSFYYVCKLKSSC